MPVNQYPPVTTESFIASCKEIFGNDYDYTDTLYINSSIKVVVCCKQHGNFTVLPGNHKNKKSGCPACAKVARRISRTDNIDTDKFIERAKLVHGNLYDYSLVKYTLPWNKVSVLCNIHGEFLTNYLHLKGIGCPKCGIEKARKTKADNGSVIPDNLRTDYELFESKVNRITENSYKQYREIINPNNHKRSMKEWHLDHKYSKQQGFLNNISPEIIGHWSNLEMLSAKQNRSKYMECSKSLDDLLHEYIRYTS